MPPIERITELKGISGEHRDGLLLCWKLRAGTARGVSPARIRRYCQRFLRDLLRPHFSVEEEWLFPSLGLDHPGVRKAMAEHRRLQRLINGRTDAVLAVTLIEEELESLIRFEERQLFSLVQEAATPGQLRELSEAHARLHARKGPVGPPEDVFWE